MLPNPKPTPPLPGGEHVQFVDTGPQGVSANATRVNLIPVGDGGPGPLLRMRRKRSKPLLPSRKELAALPRWARVAFAARCARRVLPIVRSKWPDAPVEHLEAVERAVSVAEGASSIASDEAFAAAAAAYTAAADRDSYAILIATNAGAAADDAGATYFAIRTAAYAADIAYYAILPDPNPVRVATDAAAAAASAIIRITDDPNDLRAIRRDFERFRWLAKTSKWTDDTPVSLDAVGPLWPSGRVPRWARESKRPRDNPAAR